MGNKIKNRYHKKHSFSSLVIILILLILLTGFLCFSFNFFSLPVLHSAVTSGAANDATRLINNTVLTYLKEQSVVYDDIVNIVTDEDKQITAIEIDTELLNQIKADIMARIGNEFLNIHSLSAEIPLTALFGSTPSVLSEHTIPFLITYTLIANGDTVNQFISRGINQTQHSIVLKMNATAEVFFFGKSEIIPIETIITIAETIIVGRIPEIYAGADDELWPNLIN
ncbi:MAG: hypothetical protein IJO14_12155 [Clostridia bacterium]|nr:hypothetical protein [Clostridia bacterium]